MSRVLLAVVSWNCVAVASAAEKPTRAAIIAYNDECKAEQTQADFVAKFGSDFAKLDLHDVDFSGPHAVGKESNLRGVNFRGANLRGARFGAAVLDHASFKDADLRDAQFITASLRYVNLLGAKLAGASIRESNLGQVNAAGVSFAGVDISGSDFPRANLRGATFAGALSDYSWGSFQNANLAGADLSGVTLYGAQFQQANLRAAKLIEADVELANFSGADLTGANLAGAKVKLADFRTARGLDEAQRRELVRQSGIERWERVQMVTAFLDSPWFPLLLVVVVPALVWLYRRITKNSAAKHAASDGTAAKSSRFQFSLSAMLAAMLTVSAFVGLAMWSGTGLFSLVMVTAAYLMLDSIVFRPPQRRAAAGLLIAAVVYALANIGFYVLLSASPFSIFNQLIMACAILLGPLAMLASGPVLAGALTEKWSFPKWALLGYALWMAGVAFANLWVIAQAIASV